MYPNKEKDKEKDKEKEKGKDKDKEKRKDKRINYIVYIINEISIYWRVEKWQKKET